MDRSATAQITSRPREAVTVAARARRQAGIGVVEVLVLVALALALVWGVSKLSDSASRKLCEQAGSVGTIGGGRDGSREGCGAAPGVSTAEDLASRLRAGDGTGRGGAPAAAAPRGEGEDDVVEVGFAFGGGIGSSVYAGLKGASDLVNPLSPDFVGARINQAALALGNLVIHPREQLAREAAAANRMWEGLKLAVRYSSDTIGGGSGLQRAELAGLLVGAIVNPFPQGRVTGVIGGVERAVTAARGHAPSRAAAAERAAPAGTATAARAAALVDNASYDFVIVGSGPGGLAAAMSAMKRLERQGGIPDGRGGMRAPRIAVVEKRGDAPPGADLTDPPRGSAFTRQQVIGLKAGVVKELGELGVDLGPSTAQLRTVALPRGPSAQAIVKPKVNEPPVTDPSTHVMRINELQRIMAARAREMGIELHYKTEFRGLGAGRGDKKATLELGTSEGQPIQIHADWVVGADGAGSRVRQAADIDWVRGENQGMMAGAWFSDVAGGQRIMYQDQIMPGRTGVMLGDDKVLYGLFPLPKSLAEKAGSLPDRGSDLVRKHIEGVAESFGLRQEAPNMTIKDVATFPIELNHADAAVRGPVVIVGDAARSVNPLSGSGANLAITDGVEAGRALGTAVRDPSAGTDLLSAYNAASMRRSGVIGNYCRTFASAFADPCR